MCCVIGDRLLDEHMFAFGEESACNFVVSVRRRCYRSRVNHSHEVVERCCRRRAESACNRAVPERVDVMHRGDLSRRNFRVKSCMITSDMPNANNTNAQLFHRSSMSQPRKLRGSTPESLREQSGYVANKTYKSGAKSHCVRLARNHS